MRRELKTVLIFSSLSLGAICIGCDREKPIQSYDAPKDAAPDASKALTFPDDLRWTLPAGWKQVPVQENPVFMPSAAIQVSDQPGLVLTVSKLPDAPEARSVYENIKRWSRQLKLDVPPESDVDKLDEKFQVGSIPVDFIKLGGRLKSETRLLGAIIPHGGDTWVFKLSGAQTDVDAQAGAFADFLKSIHFEGSPAGQQPATPPALPPASPSASIADKGLDGVTWALPQRWTAEPGDGFRFATVHPGSNSRSVIKVSKLNNAGSAGANVSRWHGEVGLPPVDDANADPGTEVTLGQQKWLFHDYTGPKDGGTREIIAQQDSGGSTWYFKLIGPTDEIGKLKDDFNSYMSSIRLPH